MGKSTINGHFNGIIAGWWWLEPWDFVTFHSVGKNDPNWRTHIFRGVETINQHSYVTFAEATSTSILSGFPLMLREDLQETTFFWIYNRYIISYHYISTIYIIYIYISPWVCRGCPVSTFSPSGLPGAFLRVFLDGALGRHWPGGSAFQRWEGWRKVRKSHG